MADAARDLCIADETTPPEPNANRLTEAAMATRWDADARRCARRWAGLVGPHADQDDLAQEAQIRVLTVVRANARVPERYMRKVIGNAVLAAVHRERQVAEFEPVSDEAPAPDALEVDVQAERAVSSWVVLLPSRLREVFEVLYEQGCSQREAARLLGVSQPRVAQLHQALLEQGRRDLQHLAA